MCEDDHAEEAIQDVLAEWKRALDLAARADAAQPGGVIPYLCAARAALSKVVQMMVRRIWAQTASGNGSKRFIKCSLCPDLCMGETTGLEPATSAVTERRHAKSRSISSSVLPFVSGRKKAAVQKYTTVHPAQNRNIP
jgi:hypothetical protein